MKSWNKLSQIAEIGLMKLWGGERKQQNKIKYMEFTIGPRPLTATT